MDDLTDQSEGEAPIPPMVVEPVQIVDFPNFDNLEPLIPEEVQLEDLLGFINHDDEHYQGPLHQNLQIGFVQLLQPDVDPILTSMVSHKFSQPNPEAVRLWVKYFSQRSPSYLTVLVPDAWLSFITFLLLQSPTFELAKNILQSPAWEIMSSNNSGKAYLFSIPPSCPSPVVPVCSNFESYSSVILEDLESEEIFEAVPKTPSKRKRATKTKDQPISEADLKRSQRLKKINKGFKSTSCRDKNCVGCSASPPTISQHVVRELGKTFCYIDPQELTEDKLNVKPSKTKAAKKGGNNSKDKPVGKKSKDEPAGQSSKDKPAASKRNAVRDRAVESSCDVICLQETKRETFDNTFIRNMCPSSFDHYEVLPSVGLSGGAIIIWKYSLFHGNLIFQNSYAISVEFFSKHNDAHWILTNIYAPCTYSGKREFLDWFSNIQMPDSINWLLVGDFNLCRSPEDRNRPGGDLSEMLLFNEAISSLGLIELPLKGRRFTWSNKQHSPLLERLDWFFTSA